jgi:hypothetical protein
MEAIGIDVHKRDSQVCILGDGGAVVLEQRLRTQRERLGERLGMDEPERFSGPHQVEAWLGLVPGERSSGEKQRKGPIKRHAGGDCL